MKCRDVERLLAEDLSNLESSEIQAHVKDCPRCHSLADEFRSLDALRDSLSRGVRAPEDFSKKVARRVSSSSRSFIYAVPCLLLILGAAAGWNYSDVTPPRERQLLISNRTGTELREIPISGAESLDPRTPDWKIRDSQYVEVMITDSTGQTYIVRIPSELQVRQVNGESEGYVTYVSH